MLADQTIRAIQPLKCVGMKCPPQAAIMNPQIPPMARMNEINSIMPGFRPQMFDPYSFKENNDKSLNLRGSQ